MGLFDSVYANCPTCGNRVEFQSKADIDPCMNSYTPDTAPTHILTDVLNDPQYCHHCGNWCALYDPAFPPHREPPRPAPTMRRLREPEKVHIHPSQDFLRWWDSPFSEADILPESTEGE